MKKTIASVVGIAGIAALAQACAVQSTDASKFREPIPQKSDVALGVPGSATAGSSTQSAGVKLQDNGPGGGSGGTGYAEFYSFTRSITDGVDTGTVLIIGEIEAITSLPPTTIDDNHAVWGPGSGDALDPVTWKLVVTQVGDREYDYEVDGRPHLSTSEADWKPLLQGHGYGNTHPMHRSGTFTLDNDAMRSLDPTRTSDTGTVKVTFDGRNYPIAITAAVAGSMSPCSTRRTAPAR